jgi:solute carrier family 13 (sodium-dependent dicarboxylate transporter), member 2/3/5
MDPRDPAPGPPAAPGLRPRAGLLLGPALFAMLLSLPAPAGMEPAAWRTTAVAVLMAAWWISEAVPIPVTALLPLALFPVLGIAGATAAAAPYANPVVFLFLGGFLIAIAIERCGLHRRLALAILRAVGTRPVNLIGGFMLGTAFLSMWISNTATVLMMLPMALSVIALVDREAGEGGVDPHFALALLLGLAYAANIGGMGTLIGTPPNALLAGFMSESLGVEIGFGEWMLLGVPLVAVALPLCWLLLVRVVYPVRVGSIAGGGEVIRREARGLGPVSRAEWTVGIVTAATAAAWILRPLLEGVAPGINDTGIAIAGGVLLFLVPVDWRRGEFPLTWKAAERLPWAVLILFGGGLSLAAAIQQTGLAEWIGGALEGIGAWPLVLVVLAITVVVVFLTELTSNTATAASFLPVVAALAAGIGAAPLQLAVPTALAASCAFMMPVATPPNAIVYGSERVTIPQMARAGLWLNFLLIALITAAAFLLLPRVLG